MTRGLVVMAVLLGMVLALLSCRRAMPEPAPPVPAASPTEAETATAVGLPQMIVQAGHSADVFALAYSPDGKLLVTSSEDYTSKIWDARTGLLLATLPSGRGYDIDFSADGTKIVVAGSEQITVWDARTAKLLRRFGEEDEFWRSADISADGGLVLGGEYGGAVALWDVRSGAQLWRTRPVDDEASLFSVAFSSDDSLIAAGTSKGQVEIWRTADRKRIAALDVESGVQSLHFVDVPRPYLLVSTSYHGTHVFNRQTWRLDFNTHMREGEDPGTAGFPGTASAYPNSSRFIMAGEDAMRQIYSTLVFDLASATPDPLHPVELQPIAERDAGSVVAMRPDGRAFASSVDSKVFQQNIEDGRRGPDLGGNAARDLGWPRLSSDATIADISLDSEMGIGATVDIRRGHLTRLRWGEQLLSPDGSVLLESDVDARFIDTATGATFSSLPGQLHPIMFSADGSHVLLGEGEPGFADWKRLLVAETTRGTIALEVVAQDIIRSATLSHDGQRLLTERSYQRGYDRLWDVRTGRKLATLSGPVAKGDSGYSSPGLMRFSATGDYVVDAPSAAHDIRVFSAVSGRRTRVLSGHRARVESIVFSDDDRLAFSIDADGVVMIWDFRRGKPLHTLPTAGHPTGLWVGPGAETLVVATSSTELYEVATGKRLAKIEGAPLEHPFSPDRSRFATLGKALYINDARTGEQIARHDLAAHANAVFTDEAVVAAQTRRDGGLRIHRLTDDHRAEVAMFSFRSDDRLHGGGELIAHESGLFAGDEETFERIYYRIGENITEVVTADQLFETFHRASLLSDFWQGQPLELPEAAKGGVGVPPAVRLHPLPERVSSPSVELVFDVVNRGGGAGETRIYVNGSRIGDSTRLVARRGRAQATGAGSKGMSRVADDTALAVPKTVERTATELWGSGRHSVALELAPGPNTITVESYNTVGKIRSKRHTQTVTVAIPDAAPPRLHVLVVDIGTYASDRRLGLRPDDEDAMALRFTDDDGDAVTKALERQAGRVFEQVLVERVSDLDATRDRIVEALATIRGRARRQDALVVYVSGHGVVEACDSAGEVEYQVVLTDGSRANPCADALSVRELTALAQRVPAQQKLLLLDTCQAGGAVDEKVLAQLQGPISDQGLRSARAAGVAVIAASAASESSFEVPALGHGMFTVALLRGLEGRAAYAESRRIGVSNLVRYVQRQLPILAERHAKGRQQTPTFGLKGSDFTLAEVEPDDPPLLDVRRADTDSRPAAARSDVAEALTARTQALRNPLLKCSSDRGFELSVDWPDGKPRLLVSGDVKYRCVAELLGPLPDATGTPRERVTVRVRGHNEVEVR